MSAVTRSALHKWEGVRAFALELPGAVEEYPWGPEDCVVKVDRKIFVFLGDVTGAFPPTVTVKLKDPALHAHAMSAPKAESAGYGLGKSGWVTVPLAEPGAPGAQVLCEWVEESYRTVALKRSVKVLDERRGG
ncbi:MmcQ/YjbR family DNA-binding protein [Streptomyces sp. NPDC006879]|uniref:MmcQ/YjbR family DNA-binding protein n=1 Tax=Streptomyces sp. NPDC006879 TaxID=3364767 RepID=UPI0036739EBD